MAPIRKALGDTTPNSVQFEAVRGSFTAHRWKPCTSTASAGTAVRRASLRRRYIPFPRPPNLTRFARAYSGMAAMAGNLGRLKDAEKYIKLAMEHVDRMTERERYRTRGLYYAVDGNWQKCVDEYSEFVSRYPADKIGNGNLGACYAQLRNFPKAVEARSKRSRSPQGRH